MSAYIENASEALGVTCIEPESGNESAKILDTFSREEVLRKVSERGALLFRGFDIGGPAGFEALAGQLFELYTEYDDLPKKKSNDRIYGVTVHAASEMIQFHNESSHRISWPRRQMFYCIKPSEVGGRTPVIDCVKLYEMLPKKFRSNLDEKGLTYVRNYIDGFESNWQDVFRTNDKADVERYCRERDIEYTWKEYGLRTTFRTPGRIFHEQSGKYSFFNQVLIFHPQQLEEEVREALEEMYSYDGLPRGVVWGDGSRIEDEDMAAINELYEAECVEFDWSPSDLIILDNTRFAHARRPYSGERDIRVALGNLARYR